MPSRRRPPCWPRRPFQRRWACVGCHLPPHLELHSARTGRPDGCHCRHCSTLQTAATRVAPIQEGPTAREKRGKEGKGEKRGWLFMFALKVKSSSVGDNQRKWEREKPIDGLTFWQQHLPVARSLWSPVASADRRCFEWADIAPRPSAQAAHSGRWSPPRWRTVSPGESVIAAADDGGADAWRSSSPPLSWCCCSLFETLFFCCVCWLAVSLLLLLL